VITEADSEMRLRRRHSRVAVADILRRWIALGVFGPGDRIPSERQLAHQLGVGRMTVREATGLLREEGLVATRRGQSGGTFVLDSPARPSGRVTAKMLNAVRDNFEFRRALEPAAAALTAEHASQRERRRICDLAEGDAANLGLFRMLDSRFHLAIAEACPNQLFAGAISTSRAEFFVWADAAWAKVDWDTVAPEERDFGRQHRAIAEAIRDGHAGRAAEAMSEHLELGQEQFFSVFLRFAGSLPHTSAHGEPQA
jgi:DNA-binding FadR family transcriptional regulator